MEKYNELSIEDMKAIHLCDCSYITDGLNSFFNKIRNAKQINEMPNFIEPTYLKTAEAYYHYTGANALHSILKSYDDKVNTDNMSIDNKNTDKETFTLRFSRVDYMNDVSDGGKLFDSIWEEYYKQSKAIRNKEMKILIEDANNTFVTQLNDRKTFSYICSLTVDGDSLPMWRNYTNNGGGYNIKLDPNVLFKLFDAEIYIYKMFIIPVVYDCDIMLKMLKCMMNKLCKFLADDKDNLVEATKRIVNFIVLSKMSFKHPCFSHEREIRLLKLGTHSKHMINIIKKRMPGICTPQPTIEKYDVINGILRPYIDVDIPKEALIGITVGPLLESETAKLTVENVIKTYGYNNEECPVKKSVAPIRF